MKELSPAARALLEAGLDAESSPTAKDRARVQARLTALLGASAFGAAASQAAAMAATSGSALSAGAASTGAGVGAGLGASGAAAGGAISAGAANGGVAAAGVASAMGAGAVNGSAISAAAVGGAAASGWVAALGAKGAAWIGAAALTAAVGTTAVVTRHNQDARETHAVAAGRSAAPAQQARSSQHPAAVQPAGELAAASELQRPQTVSGLPAQPNTQGKVIHPGAPAPLAVEAGAKRVPAAPRGHGDATRNAAAASGKLQPAAADAAPQPSTTASRETTVNTRISSSRLAALAARASSEHQAQGVTSEPAAQGQEADESEAELLPAPTDPDQMRAVPATSREPEPPARLPTTHATTPSHAMNPGASAVAAVSVTTAAPSGAPAETHSESAGASSAADSRQPSVVKAPQPGVALSGELELLARAQRALHDGKLSLALTLLDQHGAQHAQGSLREERLAARAVVLCRMQRVEAGSAEAQRLAALTPRSPLLPWVRAACKR